MRKTNKAEILLRELGKNLGSFLEEEVIFNLAATRTGGSQGLMLRDECEQEQLQVDFADSKHTGEKVSSSSASKTLKEAKKRVQSNIAQAGRVSSVNPSSSHFRPNTTPRGPPATTTSGKCYNCNEDAGHHAKDCPLPCPLCASKTHKRRDCPSKPQSSNRA